MKGFFVFTTKEMEIKDEGSNTFWQASKDECQYREYVVRIDLYVNKCTCSTVKIYHHIPNNQSIPQRLALS